MQELKERGAQIFTNPYVIQVDKFAGSLKKLSDTFSKLEDYRATFTNEDFLCWTGGLHFLCRYISVGR